MKRVVRVRERSGAWRQIPVGQAVVEASGHLARGEGESALALMETVVRAEPAVPVFRYLLGVAQSRQRLTEPAIESFETAVRGEDSNVDFLLALGEALMPSRPADAIPHLTRAVDLGSTSAHAYSTLAGLQVDTNHPDDALRTCDRGLAACGPNPNILGSRGRALWALGRCREALECLRRAEAALPEDLTVLLALAGVLLDLGRPEESEAYLRRACASNPASAEAHYNLGLALLVAGNYLEGFQEYEWRWRIPQLVGTRRAFPQLAWDGSPGPAGHRVLLHSEQGAGDTIQFVRYAEFVRARGATPVILAPPPLARLLGWLEGCEIAVPELPLPAFDAHCPLLSLPLLAGTDTDNIPPPANFIVPEAMKQKWSDLLGEKTGFRVGLVWAGSQDHKNDRNRSFPCGLFAPLLTIPGVTCFSLQVGPATVQLNEAIRDLAPHLTDYAETAAAITQLDLVISADTSVAHLAGSLGTPVWMLTPFAPDWRWLLHRNDSPWYPSMRLFRQRTAGDWGGVIESVRAALLELTRAVPHTPAHTDLARWSDPRNLDPAWDARARLAADFIPAGATVLDLGCGAMALEKYLPPGCRYTPCDVVARDERTLLCDFNQQPIPAYPGATHITALGVMEYVHDWLGFLRQLRALGLPVVMSYCPTDFTSHLDRPALGWVNHLSLLDLFGGFEDAGLHLQSSARVDGNQMLLRLAPTAARLPVRRRVLVMSYNNCGNFGDRLGFHLINSLLPAAAEVHFGHFEPWDVPPGEFDLLVLGTGNSIFHPLLTDQLLELVRRIPRSVGIFGTQYRESIDAGRMSDLIGSLTVWFARYEEDLLLYGAGRHNVVHLGDWLISAFPLTRWTRDQTLHVGPEVWKDLPLDRTIQDIQKYRGVVSERIHPLLCALTSAERVAYKEQREDGSGTGSGKFRSMLIDIFGRTWPESELFEFPRDAVAAYRARVMRVMSGMPELFSQLLGLG